MKGSWEIMLDVFTIIREGRRSFPELLIPFYLKEKGRGFLTSLSRMGGRLRRRATPELLWRLSLLLFLLMGLSMSYGRSQTTTTDPTPSNSEKTRPSPSGPRQYQPHSHGLEREVYGRIKIASLNESSPIIPSPLWDRTLSLRGEQKLHDPISSITKSSSHLG